MNELASKASIAIPSIASFTAFCHTDVMLSDYQQLLSDVRQFLQQECVPAQVLLTPHTFPPRAIVKSAPSLPPQAIPSKIVTAPPLPRPAPLPQAPVVPKVVPEVAHAPESVRTPETALSTFSGTHIKELLKQVAPHVKTIEQIPDDSEAHKIAEAWKERQAVSEIVILSFGEPEKERLFLYNLARAIDTAIRPARVIDGRRLEKENKWDILLQHKELRIVFAPPVLTEWPGLMRLYKELPATQEILLGDKPLFLLDPLSSYLKTPTLKHALWKRICTLR